jgi:CBS domain-containing protein
MNRLDSKRIQIREILEVQTANWPHLDLRVGDCMTRNPEHVTSTTSLPEIVQLYHAKQFRHLLVVDEFKGLVGVISDRDVLHGQKDKTRPRQLDKITASDIMSCDILMIDTRAPAIEALRTMLSHGINCLPVHDEGRLVGILTTTDLHVVLEFLLDPAFINRENSTAIPETVAK